MNPALQGYTAAIVDGVAADDRPALVADVSAVDRLFSENAPLRTALTDIAVPARARRAVLEELLGGQVSAAARRLCGYATGAVVGHEVPEAVSWVATRVRHVTETGEETEQILGYQEARQRVGGYAAAVFEELAASDLEEVEDELFRFARTVAGTPPLRAALADRDVPAPVRRALADDLLSGKVRPATLRLVRYTITGGRARDVVGTLDWLVEQTAIARGWRVARVRSGQEIDAGGRARLVESLSRVAGIPVELQVTVDPALLAGVHVEIGDLVLEATVRGRLDRLREHMLAGSWTDRGFGRPARAGRAAAPGPAAAAGGGNDTAAGGGNETASRTDGGAEGDG